MAQLNNSKRYAFEISSAQDLQGVMYVQIPPRNSRYSWQSVRAWVPPTEKLNMSRDVKPTRYMAIFLGQSESFPFLKWGDEIMVISGLGEYPVLDVHWLKEVIVDGVEPTPMEKPPLGQKRDKEAQKAKAKAAADLRSERNRAEKEERQKAAVSEEKRALPTDAICEKEISYPTINPNDLDQEKLNRICKSKIERSIRKSVDFEHVSVSASKVEARTDFSHVDIKSAIEGSKSDGIIEDFEDVSIETSVNAEEIFDSSIDISDSDVRSKLLDIFFISKFKS